MTGVQTCALPISYKITLSTSIQPSDDNVILYVPLCTGAGASTNPANVLSDLGARSGAIGNFTSLNGSKVTIVANGSGHVARLPEASFGKSVPVNVARSLSSGHLNLSQPAGSCASAGTALTHRANTMHRSFTARLFSSKPATTFRDHALIDRDHDVGGFDNCYRCTAGLKSELFDGFIGD